MTSALSDVMYRCNCGFKLRGIWKFWRKSNVDAEQVYNCAQSDWNLIVDGGTHPWARMILNPRPVIVENFTRAEVFLVLVSVWAFSVDARIHPGIRWEEEDGWDGQFELWSLRSVSAYFSLDVSRIMLDISGPAKYLATPRHVKYTRMKLSTYIELCMFEVESSIVM